ncbi:DUF1294 domain-containing protein [uncultured Microscilla sp.]|uniref:DUF1294 domain-containing protein n=1 Tax=uncultured Microscilla sp. TaxID=432653 RepID=UPI00263360B0|nr:DUF1294 domain-containing protein [uncultured Microscilla sp.]
MLLVYYLVFINVVAAFVFSQDKGLAKRKQRRISEKRLHTFELAGGVFSVLVLMYTLRHKNQKLAYYGWTYLILALWIGVLYLVLFYFGR